MEPCSVRCFMSTSPIVLPLPTQCLPHHVQLDLVYAFLHRYRACRILGQSLEQSLATLGSESFVFRQGVAARLAALADRTWGHEWLLAEADQPQTSV